MEFDREEWQWLYEVPDEWEAPEELTKPTRYPEVNMAIKMLSCEYLRFEVRVAIGRFVTEEALYDLWFLENIRRTGMDNTKREALLRQVPMNQTKVVYDAWKKLEAIEELDHVVPNEVVRERRMAAIENLQAALEEAVEGFVRIRAENSPE